ARDIAVTGMGVPVIAMLWDPADGLQALATPEWTNATHAEDINNAGQIIGYTTNESGQPVPLLWDGSLRAYDLNTLLPKTRPGAAAVKLGSPVDINNEGSILALGSEGGDAYLLTPSFGSCPR